MFTWDSTKKLLAIVRGIQRDTMEVGAAMAAGATTRVFYADAVRGREVCTMENPTREKLIRIVMSFAGVDRGWSNVNNKLILERRWVEMSAHIDKISEV